MRRLTLIAVMVAGLFMPATAGAAADANKAYFYSSLENQAVNRVLTANLGFGPSSGETRGMSAVSIDPNVITTEETRGYFGQYNAPCYLYRTRVVLDQGQYYGVQNVWRVSCSTGAILSGGHVVTDRTWGPKPS